MLNKLFIILTASFFCFTCSAKETLHSKTQSLKITPIKAVIKEPFTSFAILELKLDNLTDEEISIIKIKSNQARHVDFYKTFKSEIGAQQIKKTNLISIPAKQQISFSIKDAHQIRATGLKRRYKVGEEIILELELNNKEKIKTYLPIFANYY